MTDAPEKIWAYVLDIGDGKTMIQSWSEEDFGDGDVEYTRTDAISPAQAAKVLLEAMADGSVRREIRDNAGSAATVVRVWLGFDTAMPRAEIHKP